MPEWSVERWRDREIKTESDVREFFTWLIRVRKISVHPDEMFASYVNFRTGELTFTPDECVVLDSRMTECHKVAGDEVYDICVQEFDSFMIENQPGWKPAPEGEDA